MVELPLSTLICIFWGGQEGVPNDEILTTRAMKRKIRGLSVRTFASIVRRYTLNDLGEWWESVRKICNSAISRLPAEIASSVELRAPSILELALSMSESESYSSYLSQGKPSLIETVVKCISAGLPDSIGKLVAFMRICF